ncbi:MAG: MoaD/ThiS family protein [Euryarchaeota archaeon]|nr:MoaD/ThiS family protein [Euryarchaeota archaeon]
MVAIKIPTPLRRFAGDNAKVEVKADTVGEAVRKLTEQHEALKNHLYDENGELRNFVNLYLNQKDVRTLQKDETPTKEGDELVIVPSIAGGAADGVLSREVAEGRVEASIAGGVCEAEVSRDEVAAGGRMVEANIVPFIAGG